MLTEAERVARFGFTASELERQKQAILRTYERVALEKENRESASRADEYVRNFLQNDTLPSADDEYNLHKRFLPEITLDEINKLASEWIADRNRTSVVRAPEKSGFTIPDQFVVGVRIACEMACEVALPSADLMVLAEFSADFLLPKF